MVDASEKENLTPNQKPADPARHPSHAPRSDVRDKVEEQVNRELRSAMGRFPAFASEHEGYAVLLEEVDELWEAIRLKQTDPNRMQQIRREAIQVAAMALRLIYDRCDRHPATTAETFGRGLA